MVRSRNPQLFQATKLYHGGSLRRQRAGRGARPLSSRNGDSLHLILKSSRAVGPASFRAPGNKEKVLRLLEKFAARNAVQILSLANAGNHLHIHLRLTTRHTYRAFIRAATAAIAMAVTGASRWKKPTGSFWDYRPYSRVVRGRRAFLSLRDYLHVNQLETAGANRQEARLLVAWRVSRGKHSAWAETG